jgi:hypothetical protein
MQTRDLDTCLDTLKLASNQILPSAGCGAEGRIIASMILYCQNKPGARRQLKARDDDPGRPAAARILAYPEWKKSAAT